MSRLRNARLKKSIKKPFPTQIFLATGIEFYSTNKLLEEMEDKNRQKWEVNQIT
jgi:hypothetical protein